MKTLTARHIGYLVESQMLERYKMKTDKSQLQKLVYISFGYYGGALEKYLFTDKIEAWQYGPVVPTLYYKGTEKTTSPVEENIRATIEAVVCHYGKYSSNKLVALTHSPGTPWSKVYQENMKNIEIPKDLIISHYMPIMKGLGFMSDSGLLDELART